MAKPVVDFDALLVKTDTCWPIQRQKGAKGYGRFSRTSYWYRTYGERGAHRVAWILAHGAIAQNMCVLHTCDNPPCCNPDHLFLGTKGENNTDRAQKTRSAKNRGAAKLTAEHVVMIRRLRRRGWKLKRLARIFNCSKSTIGLISQNKTW